MTAADLHTLTGAYALDALDGAEAGAFERHMAECGVCAQEVRELRETAARLALGVALVPPPAMRERVMAAVAGVRQLPPLVPEADVVPLRGRRRGRGRLSYLAAAACLVIAVGAGGWAVNAQREAERDRARLESVRQETAMLVDLMSAPDTTMRTAPVSGGGEATVVTSRGLNRAAFLYRDLPELPDSQVYQLWYDEDGSMKSAGLVDAPEGGSGAMLLAGGPRGTDGVGVTVEPAGGSAEPSGAPVMLVPFKG